VTDIYTVVSRPGPVESAILAELEGVVTAHRRPLPPAMLRTLEGGAGEPVLLLHGRAGASPSFFPFFTPLVRTHRVIAVDLPGLGHSSSPPFQSDEPEAALRFFVDPIVALVRELGLEGASIVGHSLGGLVALELALRGYVKPKRLGLIAPLGVSPSMSAVGRAFYRFGPERLANVLGAKLFSWMIASGGVAERFAALEAELSSVLGGKSAPLRATRALVPARGPVFSRSSELQRIEAETLLVWGERDPVLPAPSAIAAGASVPQAELWMVPGLGHAPHLEDAALVVPRIVSFLR